MPNVVLKLCHCLTLFCIYRYYLTSETEITAKNESTVDPNHSANSADYQSIEALTEPDSLESHGDLINDDNGNGNSLAGESLPEQCLSIKNKPVDAVEEIINVSSDMESSDSEIDLSLKENFNETSSDALTSLKGLDMNRLENSIRVQDQENTEESEFKGLDSTDPENFSNLHLTVSDIEEDSFSADLEQSGALATDLNQPSQAVFDPAEGLSLKGIKNSKLSVYKTVIYKIALLFFIFILLLLTQLRAELIIQYFCKQKTGSEFVCHLASPRMVIVCQINGLDPTQLIIRSVNFQEKGNFRLFF